MALENQVNNKQIAKNTMVLYFRMLITTVVSLYTTRVVLATLGVNDYGIFGLVGGVVSILGFLNAAMSGSTSRFLTFELAKGDKKKLTDTFSTAMIAHLLIALIVLLISETIGLWFLYNRLVIPADRMFAAHCVYQFSILSALLTITQVPYNSSIIAHEKMDVYAYVEIVNVGLKLFIVYLLTIWNFDKLILYAVLVFAVSFIVMMGYRIYCLKNFLECKFHFIWDMSILRPMLSFSGWDMFGNMSVAIRQQGSNFLVNMFFGVAYNAAAGVALSVQGVIHGLCYNTLTAFRPQIIKQYSIGENQQSVNLINNAAKLSTALLILIVVPFTFEMDYIMKLWLGTPPAYASLFCVIMLWAGCLNMCENAIGIGIQATARLKAKSFLCGIIYLLAVPLIWISFLLDLPVETAYYISIFVSGCSIFIMLVLLKRYIPEFSGYTFIGQAVLPNVLLLSITFICLFPIIKFMDDGLLRALIVCVVDVFIGGISAMYILLNKGQRSKLLLLFKKRIHI